MRGFNIALYGAIAVFVLSLPFWLSNSKLLIATATGIIAIIAVSLVMLTGWAGHVSLGQMAFAAIGGAVGAWVTQNTGWDLGFAMLAAGAVGALVAVAVGIPAARAGGLTLAVTTLALAPAVLFWLLNPEFFDWVPRGRFDSDPTLFGTIEIKSQMSFYFLTLSVLALAIAIAYGIRRSRTGRVLIALRENPRAAEAYGINALRTMLAGFAISGFLAAVAGVLFVHHQHMISQDTMNNPFSAESSLRVFAIVVIGGMASVPGAILGAVYVYALQYYMLPEWRFLATGVGLLGILLILPGGLGAGLAEARDAGPPVDRPSPQHHRAEPARRPAGRHARDDAVDGRGRGRRDRSARGRRGPGDGHMTMVRPNPPPTERRVLFKIRGIPVHPPRGPKRYFTDATDGYAIYPLVVLFGLNAVDELDRSVFGVLGPEIRDSFGLSNQGYLSLVALTLIGGLLLELPLAYYADRLPRARLAVIGALVWSVFGFATGLTTTILMLVIVRSGAGMGRAVVTPTHLSLLSDYYPLESRTKVYGVHRIANAVGLIVGPLVGGILAEQFGWRVPFFVFVIPSLVFVFLGLRLKEPGRGHFERAAGGAEQAVIETDEEPPSWAESVRILWQVRTLRRIWFSLPFLAASVIGLASLTSIYYEEVFHLSESQRGFVAASAEPFGVIGIMVGISLASRLILKDPGMGLRLLSFVADRHRGRLDRVRARARALGRDRRQHPHLRARGAARTGHLRLALARHPAQGALAGLLDGLAVHPAGAHRAVHGRWHRRPLRHSPRHADHGAGVPDRRHDPVVRVAVREVRHQQGVDLDRRASGGALPAFARAK